MTQPLALLFFEKLMPGSQLTNRLQDAGWRVLTVGDAARLVPTAEQEKPMLVFTDLAARNGSVCAEIAELKRRATTSHLPVVAFAGERDTVLQEAAQQAGATLVVNDNALLAHLQQFIDRALEV